MLWSGNKWMWAVESGRHTVEGTAPAARQQAEAVAREIAAHDDEPSNEFWNELEDRGLHVTGLPLDIWRDLEIDRRLDCGDDGDE